MVGEGPKDALNGTTLRVYRFLYRSGEPQGIHDVQNGLHLSSSSVAAYHIKKLLEVGLIRQAVDDSTKYFVDRLIFENMIRIKKSLIPLQIGYLAFFASAVIVLLILLRPIRLDGSFVFSVIVILIACAIFSYQILRSLAKSQI
ncbi:MAG: helix-turn-helix domain-containing protein [Nitrososphaerales archaeon]